MQKLMGLVRRCVDDYHMIEAGDRIAVGVSGGKDSLTLLVLLAGLREYLPISHTTLEAITIDMGLGMDYSQVAGAVRAAGRCPITVVQTEIGPIIFDYRQEKNPCSMCAKMRRGALNQAMLERRHSTSWRWDTTMTTRWRRFSCRLLFEGRISCFQPVTEP